MLDDAMSAISDSTILASELRIVLGRLMRRLRAEYRFPLSQAAVLGRLDREGPQSVSDLAAAEHLRHQSMAQTVLDLEAEGMVVRTSDPDDRRRFLVSLTPMGGAALEADRRKRDGWLAQAIEAELTAEERAILSRATALLDRVSEV
jgi:DNA-binding MarR family transcriptional regulator